MILFTVIFCMTIDNLTTQQPENILISFEGQETFESHYTFGWL